MSFSLHIRHGDLALNGRTFDTVSEGQKLVQDLRCALLTPLGFFEEHPDYGSNLDNGTDNIIGQVNWDEASTLLRAEINRICADYQRVQISRNQADAGRYGKMTITPGEMLLQIDNIEMVRAEDTLLVTVALGVGTERIIKFSVPIASA